VIRVNSIVDSLAEGLLYLKNPAAAWYCFKPYAMLLSVPHFLLDNSLFVEIGSVRYVQFYLCQQFF